MDTHRHDEMYHYGIKGMRWGVRRYQNEDGSLTSRGVKRYAEAGYAQDSYNRNKTRAGKAYDKVTGAHKYAGRIMYDISSDAANKRRAEKYAAEQKAAKEARNTPEARKARIKKAVVVGAAAAGTVAAVYGAYKLNQFVKERNCQIAVARGHKEVARLVKESQQTMKQIMKSDTWTSASYNVNNDAIVGEYLRNARSDNFVQAAKNVIDSARSKENINFRYSGELGASYINKALRR